MENSSSLPDVKSAKLMHISELPQWYGDEVHGNSVRVLGRIVKVDVANDVIDVEYHGARLRVCSKLLDGGYGGFMPGTLFQFLGELERNSQRAGELLLKARLYLDMNALDTDMYDRCLRIRRDFEEKLLRQELHTASNSSHRDDAREADR